MADLDDFFKKKDKKKKGFSKANTEVLAKNLAENERKVQQAQERANDASRATSSGASGKESDTDEWKNLEELKSDYSDLKIDNLQKTDSDKEDGNAEKKAANEDGEKSQSGGPWSKVVSTDGQETEDTSKEDKREEEASKKEAEPAATTTSSYVPPHLRNASSSSSTLTPTVGGPRGARKSRQAPDVSSNIAFPSLSATMGADKPDGSHGGQTHDSQGFEEVKSGGSGQVQHQSSQGPKLTLDNKFAALRGQ